MWQVFDHRHSFHASGVGCRTIREAELCVAALALAVDRIVGVGAYFRITEDDGREIKSGQTVELPPFQEMVTRG